MWLARFAFQACSFNHSDISPSLKSKTYERSRTDYRTRRRFPLPSSIVFAFSGFKARARASPENCVRPANAARSLTAISSSWRRDRGSRLVFLNEVKANLAMGRSHAWVLRGQEYVELRPMNWGDNLTLVCDSSAGLGHARYRLARHHR